MLYSVSISAIRIRGGTLDVHHAPVVIEATSHDEANGKGLRVAEKLFPPADGWGNRSAHACTLANVVNPDGNITIIDKPR